MIVNIRYVNKGNDYFLFLCGFLHYFIQNFIDTIFSQLNLFLINHNIFFITIKLCL